MAETIRTMTAAEFRAVGAGMYGGRGWQRALADRLGVADRTVRRWASGASRIPPEVVRELGVMHAATEWPRDEWITGEGAADVGGHRREYVLRTAEPRFVARAVLWDDFIGMMPQEAPADCVSGVTFRAADDTMLCEIVWIDPPPHDEEELRRLLQGAADALAEAGAD